MLTREQLLDSVTRRPDEVYDRVVDVHVANLRRKLGDDPAEPWLIETIPQVGYRLVATPGSRRDRGVARGRRWRGGSACILGAIVLGVLLVAGHRRQSGRQRRVRDRHRRPAAAAPRRRGGQPRRSVWTGRSASWPSSAGSPTTSAARSASIANDGTFAHRLRAPARWRRRPLHRRRSRPTAQTLATLEADLPAQVGDRGFLPLFNVTLLVGGVLSVLGIALASTYVATRLTRPLRDVADAARRLGAGETAARATGGDDRESADLADSFNAMADRLERSEMLRRRAASDIAHDLATPATVLVSQLQAMVDGVVPADRENLEAARSAASALGSVVAELNDLASAEAAPLQAQPTAVDLGGGDPRGRTRARRPPPRARPPRLESACPAGTIVAVDPRPPVAGPAQRHRRTR